MHLPEVPEGKGVAGLMAVFRDPLIRKPVEFRDTGKRVLRLADDREIVLERTKDGMRIVSGDSNPQDFLTVVFEWLWLQGEHAD